MNILDNAEKPYENDDRMVDAAAQYFEKALPAEACEMDEDFLRYIDKKINQDDNDQLSAIPMKQEIIEVVNKLNGDAAPGPDGFNGFFFQKYWMIIKTDVVKAVQAFFHGAALP